MKTLTNGMEKVIEALRLVYLKKEDIEIDRQWEGKVMTCIREMADFESRRRFLPMFERLVWRLVPVTSLVLAGLIALFFVFDLAPEYDLAQLMNGADELMSQIFGV
jgi:hypothetical protein